MPEPASSSSPASSPAPGGVDFLAHQRGGDVAVAVRDTGPGPASAAYLDSGDRFEITARDAIPLGHKVALRDLAGQENVLEYGVPIGRTRDPVAAGEAVGSLWSAPTRAIEACEE